jgi:hypothetical protein
MVPLDVLTTDFAAGIGRVDGSRPVAVNQRSGVAFQAGIGPRTEVKTISLVMAELSGMRPDLYVDYKLGVPYGAGSRQACDLCLGRPPNWDWAIEVKMLRLMGDNGKANDNILMHILSPYPAQNSALTDCLKLEAAHVGVRQAVMIYGYDYDGWPMDPVIEAFELLAAMRVDLGSRREAAFDGLVHPIHVRGRVFAWEIGREQ